MKLKILNKTSYQLYPITDDMVELDIKMEELEQIGKTKCFDLETNKIVDYTSPFSEPKEIYTLRERREIECFTIINRGTLWYETLTKSQKEDLRVWYKEWLDVTDKYKDGIDIESIIPKKPDWLK